MKNNIPFFSLNRQWNTIKDDLNDKIIKLLESSKFIGGSYVKEFEKEFARYTKSLHAISCNSGTDALWLAMKALEIKPNSIVLTTPLSFIASSSEIISHNAYPTFIDIDESYNISPKKIEDWLKSNVTVLNNKAFHTKTKLPVVGIITVDLFGQCADYNKIKSIAKEYNLWIIEDACQAVGAKIDDKKAGNFGDISCFSLYPTKNLGVCGDGGILTTNNPNLAEKLFMLKNHGRKSHYNYQFYGRNSRLDAIQALVATEKLKLLDSWNKRRREIAHTYTKQLSKLDFIKTPEEHLGYHVYHQYCIEIQDERITRDSLQAYLKENNIGTNIYYPKALYEIDFLVPRKDLLTDCPRTKAATKNILALPIWPELTDEEVGWVIKQIESRG